MVKKVSKKTSSTTREEIHERRLAGISSDRERRRLLTRRGLAGIYSVWCSCDEPDIDSDTGRCNICKRQQRPARVTYNIPQALQDEFEDTCKHMHYTNTEGIKEAIRLFNDKHLPETHYTQKENKEYWKNAWLGYLDAIDEVKKDERYSKFVKEGILPKEFFTSYGVPSMKESKEEQENDE